jgi:phosphatidate cytidylyltransferase
MKRLLTAAVIGPPFLAAVFLLPAPWFFLLITAVVCWAAAEFVRILRPLAPQAPLALLPWLVALAAAGLALAVSTRSAGAVVAQPEARLLAVGLAFSLGLSCIVLLGRTPVAQSLVAVGGMCFGIVYLALPAVAIHRLQQTDPWLLLLLLAVVWIGDSAAFYLGRRFGRHKLAPVVSPNKSWEGAAASFVAALLATAGWSLLVLGRLDPVMLVLGAATNLAAQLGDLVESMFKRGSGIKDSGALLPGHGGMLDRIDSLLFAAPVLWIGVLLIGRDAFTR